MQATNGAASTADSAQWPASPADKLPQTLRERLDHRPTLSWLQVCNLSHALPFHHGLPVYSRLHAGSTAPLCKDAKTLLAL